MSSPSRSTTLRHGRALLLLLLVACGGATPEPKAAPQPTTTPITATPVPQRSKPEPTNAGIWTVPEGPRDRPSAVEFKPISLEGWKKAVKAKGVGPAAPECAPRAKGRPSGASDAEELLAASSTAAPIECADVIADAVLAKRTQVAGNEGH